MTSDPIWQEAPIHMPTLEEVFDYYQAVIYDREKLADAIGKLLLSTQSRLVLDCACGTGLPAIDLRARGFRIDCSDSDALMLDQFRRNARVRGIEDSAFQLSWEDLGWLGVQYDYVMCRGNSLVYADSWTESTAPAASLRAIERQVRGIAAVVAPGGYLHVDAPRTSDVAEVSYPETLFRGERVRVSEQVTVLNGHRRWEQCVAVGPDEFSFVRNSSNLIGSQLSEILRDNGFTSVETIELTGERPSYQVLLGRKSCTDKGNT
jgi:SAM-dependent methyltransferase